MKDARRRHREVVDHYMPVIDRDSGNLIGYLTDITVDGGMIQTDAPLEEGQQLSLRIESAEPIEGDAYIDVDGRCVWSRKGRNAVFHHAGLEFLQVDEALRDRIAELAERYRLAVSG